MNGFKVKAARRGTVLAGRLRAVLRDERGATAVFFAIGLLVMAPVTLGLVDVYMITTQRSQLQDALDTATLYAARSDKTTTEDIQVVGDNSLRANLKLSGGQEITYSRFTLDGIKVISTARISPPSIGPRLWVQNDIEANSEVLRNSNNVEVALVLDTTGSMSDQMENLRTAAKDLVDLVVKDKQPPEVPYYTKVALVPYAVGVNVDSWADTARGSYKGPITVDSVTADSSKKKIIVKAVGHGFQTGDRVLFENMGRAKVDSNSMSTEFKVTRESNDLFSLSDYSNSKFSGSYASGGKVYCLKEGCEKFSFTNASSKLKTFSIGNCVSERIGSEAYTDAAPSAAPVGRLYDGGSGNACDSQPIVPLSSSKTMLKSKIDALRHGGSTAGQIGLAWGWYMVSPNWNALWTGASAPAAYDTPETLKVVILMTDGAFNSPYCKGVIAKDAGSGSGSSSDHINCNATNGDPFDQAETLCTNMKAKGVIVYTVGFNVGSDKDVKSLMRNCATSPEYVYMPSNGNDLKIAFRAIAQDINSLRISK
ncbi:pilus assembly protein TadG-related protein [Phenylobacterium sp.]|uniref:pilus assembly protein TadG-related protein n=1 Tax=Phenylobacterium sp. TaxID=1871053 RepID=UPI0035B017CC